MKVSQFYNKNQFLITDKEEKYFQSYDSLVAKVDRFGDLTLYSDWDYSNTTRKHLYMFLYEYCYRVYSEIYRSKNKRKEIERLIKEQVIKFELE